MLGRVELTLVVSNENCEYVSQQRCLVASFPVFNDFYLRTKQSHPYLSSLELDFFLEVCLFQICHAWRSYLPYFMTKYPTEFF